MYDIRFRRKVLEIREKEGLSIRAVAKRFGISFRSVMSWLQRLDPILKRQKPATKLDMAALAEDVRRYNDAFHRERAERLGVSAGCIAAGLRRLKVTYKKKPVSSEGVRRRTAILPKNP